MSRRNTDSKAKVGARTAGLFTRKALAVAFDVHEMTVTKWERDGLPIEVRGGPGRPSYYRLKDCIEWRVQRELQARGVDTESLSPQVERALLDRSRREQVDLAVQVRRGELVLASDVAREFADVAVNVKARLRAIPDAVADIMAGAAAKGPIAVKTLLMQKIDEALRELAAKANTPMPAPADDPDDQDDDAPEGSAA